MKQLSSFLIFFFLLFFGSGTQGIRFFTRLMSIFCKESTPMLLRPGSIGSKHLNLRKKMGVKFNDLLL